MRSIIAKIGIAFFILLGIMPGSAWAATLYRSVGTTATNLNTSGRTVTISGTTATFSGAMPNNVGVGDALVYGSTYIAFISGRTSDTVYTVQSATGGTPTAASGASVGVYRSFNSLANWEANTTANANINAAVSSSVLMPSLDLVTAGNILMVPCYADGVDSTAVTVEGWTTGASNYIKIYTPVSLFEAGASQRHSGVWNDNAYRIEATMSGSFQATVVLNNNYVQIDGLQIKVNHATYDDTYAVRIFNYGYGRVSNCIIVGNNPNNTLYAYGIATVNAGPDYFWNNIIYGFSGEATDAGLCLWGPAAAEYVYNNTVIDCAMGIDASSSALVVAKNNIIKGSGNTNTYTGTYAAGTDYNSTDSTDTPGVGSNNLTSQTFTFKDAANKDFHLLSTDTGAKDKGTDLSADANLPFSVDIDGTSRPVGASWDIGADEFKVVPVYYSVGTNTAALYSGNASASGGTLTLASAASNNIGVGDEIRYGSNRYYITGRTSSTVFSIQNSGANGGIPGDANITFSSTAITIYRAFNSLYAAEDGADGANYMKTTNLVTGNYQLNIACYKDGVDTYVGGGTNGIALNEWTTSNSNYIHIYTPVASSEVGTSQRHTGKAGTGYRFAPSIADMTFYGMLINLEANVHFEGIEMDGSNLAGTEYVQGILLYDNSSGFTLTSNDKIYINDNIIHDLNSAAATGSAGVYGIQIQVTAQVYITNNIIYNLTTNTTGASGASGIENDMAGSVFYVYNNTILNTRVQQSTNYAFGIYNSSTGAGYLKNNYAGGVISVNGGEACYYGTFASGSTNNASSDGTASSAAGLSNGIINLRNYSSYFKDTTPGREDLHLRATATAFIDAGTSLAADTYYPFSTDIDGATRPYGSGWDIGADENDGTGGGGTSQFFMLM